MKTRIIFCFLSLVFSVTSGNAFEKVPVAVSPGSESGIALVRQGCPTFSWSAVQWAEAYRVVVFKAVGGDVLEYEEMDGVGYAVINKEIRGPALSWTPSENERLSNGEFYVWYVQAVDDLGVGTWSEGRMFIVEEVEEIVAVGEKVRERLREYGVREEVITEVLKDFKAGVDTQGSGYMTPGLITDKGTEGDKNTFYGKNAGRITKGKYNSFFGSRAGYSNTTGKYNVFLGFRAGYKNTWGAYNTFIGDETGYYNSSGNNNTFIGYRSGYKNTKGLHNSFYGSWAGHKNTTGGANAFLGYRSGYKNSSGSSNTFIGEQTGYNNTTGKYNTFLGHAAGFQNTKGDGNVFLGRFAGFQNTTGEYNTFVGHSAGGKNITGKYSTFIGYGAGSENTTGLYNTSIGAGAGYKNTKGRYNTFLGYYAGYKNTTGGNNTLLGYRAGENNSTGLYNTFLGYRAGYTNTAGGGNVFLGQSAGYNEKGSNRLYIDNSSTDSPLIFGKFDSNVVIINGKLGVGKNPTNLIEVNGGAYCNGIRWVDASSREYKENIKILDTEEAMDALDGLKPVMFRYKSDKEEEHVGFIAEDVPDLVATKDRKGMSAMDVVAVLTKVVQEQQEELQEQQKSISELREMIVELKAKKQDK